MTENERRTGRIKKIVRVPSIPASDDSESLARGLQGYGILRDQGGQDVFFVDSAVCDVDFADLQTGTRVTYVMELGPLGRAAQVWVQLRGTQVAQPSSEPCATGPQDG